MMKHIFRRMTDNLKISCAAAALVVVVCVLVWLTRQEKMDAEEALNQNFEQWVASNKPLQMTLVRKAQWYDRWYDAWEEQLENDAGMDESVITVDLRNSYVPDRQNMQDVLFQHVIDCNDLAIKEVVAQDLRRKISDVHLVLENPMWGDSPYSDSLYQVWYYRNMPFVVVEWREHNSLMPAWNSDGKPLTYGEYMEVDVRCAIITFDTYFRIILLDLRASHSDPF